MADTKRSDIHIFFLPFSAHGHTIPLVDAALLFARRGGVRCTVVTTPGNSPSTHGTILRARDSEGLPIHLELVPFPSAEVGLPEGVECTDALPPSPDALSKFSKGVDLLRHPIRKLIVERRPDCIVSDWILLWAADLADSLSIPHFRLSHCSSFLEAVVDSIRMAGALGDVVRPAGLPHPLRFTREELPYNVRFPGFLERTREAQRKSCGVIMNSFDELEPEYVEHRRNVNITGGPMNVWSIGPVQLYKSLAADDWGVSTAVKGWLDTKPPASVVYISFGSEGRFGREQLREIAVGLRSCADSEPMAAEEAINEEKLKDEKQHSQTLLSVPIAPPLMSVSHAKTAPPPPAAVMMMQQMNAPVPIMQQPRPPAAEYGLVETSPPLAGRARRRSLLSYGGGGRCDKISSTYDLVEQMQYLYVHVVKARDLPAMDVTGSLDPYVEVKLGNYKGVTRVIEKNQSPVWNQVFAFSKERLQAHFLEVAVKDKDFLTKDDFVGRVGFDLAEIPVRVPPDSPLAPQWYRLEDKRGEKSGRGEVMLAVWMGTQADEAFPDAWHSDAHSVSLEGLTQTRSKVYFSPKLCYLRVHAIEAQDLVPSDHSRPPDVYLKVQLGGQIRRTRPSPVRSVNPAWNEELVLVASEPLDEPLVITVEDRVGPNKDEPIGRIVLPVSAVAYHRTDHSKLVEARWYSLGRAKGSPEDEEEKKKESKFSSKIHLRIFLDLGYHVLDESTHYSSDLRPSEKNLRKPSIGILELGILNARNLMPMKARDGRGTDAYCVAKYGPKWVRTRTILNSLAPRWNEQYTWEVFDPCTVVTIGVFDNNHINGGKEEANSARDQRIGKVRIRLSTLETDRVYTHYYPLLVLQPAGLKKTGELHLAVRFTCTAWVNMVSLYGKPLLPKMHYIQPIPVIQLDYLRHQAMQIVAARLARAEPPLRREAVEYMLDVDSHMWSLRRSKANFYRITSLLAGIGGTARWFDGIRNWRNPVTTILVHVLFLILVCYPELILPTVFLYLFMIGIWNYRFRPRNPPHMDTKLSHAELAHPDELDEEFDTFPTSRPPDVVRMRYDRLRSVAGRVQAVVGDLATQGERAHALLSWRDPRATAIFVTFSVICTVLLYVTPFQVVAVIAGVYLLRHPRFRSRMPSVPYNFYRRLPAKSDMLL